MPLDLRLSELAARVGEDVGASRWLEISQQQIEEFARVTGDHHWMHVDSGARRASAAARLRTVS